MATNIDSYFTTFWIVTNSHTDYWKGSVKRSHWIPLQTCEHFHQDAGLNGHIGNNTGVLMFLHVGHAWSKVKEKQSPGITPEVKSLGHLPSLKSVLELCKYFETRSLECMAIKAAVSFSSFSRLLHDPLQVVFISVCTKTTYLVLFFLQTWFLKVLQNPNLGTEPNYSQDNLCVWVVA